MKIIKRVELIFQIKVLPTVREVIAVYTVDEAQMELIITLPTNYPLTGPEVQCNRQIGGTSHKQWLMQFKKCVLHQVSGHLSYPDYLNSYIMVLLRK